MLNHQQYSDQDILEVSSQLDRLCVDLDQKHRMQRKIQFLLDVRGYLLANRFQGNYVEFGVYRGEMLYCAWKILEKMGALKNYIGLDTFSGEPNFNSQDRQANPFLVEGDYAADLPTTEAFLKKFIGERVKLIQGDFRQPQILQKVHDDAQRVVMAVIDCNLVSSIESALHFIVPEMISGGLLFIDDFFINMGHGQCPAMDLLKKLEQKFACRFVEYRTYPPFARAFVKLDSGK